MRKRVFSDIGSSIASNLSKSSVKETKTPKEGFSSRFARYKAKAQTPLASSNKGAISSAE